MHCHHIEIAQDCISALTKGGHKQVLEPSSMQLHCPSSPLGITYRGGDRERGGEGGREGDREGDTEIEIEGEREGERGERERGGEGGREGR